MSCVTNGTIEYSDQKSKAMMGYLQEMRVDYELKRIQICEKFHFTSERQRTTAIIDGVEDNIHGHS
jgi:hypothetical protein